MSKISEYISIFSAYAARPHLYPELARKIKKNLFNRSSALRGKEEAEKWCDSLAISEDEFIKKYIDSNYQPFRDKYKDLYAKALEIEKSCPVTMGGAGALDTIYYIAEHINAKYVLETGVAYGWSSFAALASLVKRDGKLFSSDMPYMSKNNDQYVGCIVPDEYRKNWELFRFADRESLPKIFKVQNTFDFVHYDSDKTYDGRMWAYDILWEKLRKGGVFMSDDIGDNAAFMDYCIKNKRKPVIIEFDGKYAGIIFKE